MHQRITNCASCAHCTKSSLLPELHADDGTSHTAFDSDRLGFTLKHSAYITLNKGQMGFARLEVFRSIKKVAPVLDP